MPSRMLRMSVEEFEGRKKPAKYRAEPTALDGHKFASKKEANRYAELKLMEKAKLIFDLELQPVLACIVNGVHVCDYIADFRYRENHGLKLQVTEDVKGVRTPVYRLKKKLVKACRGVEITEV